RLYFFHRIDESWFDWLQSNGFLDGIKQEAEDKTRYSYSMPELGYLERMAGKIPKEVVDFMLSFNARDNFNPEVIDRFLRICSALPAEQLARMVKKIKDEQWVRLMAPFDRWGFEYSKMFEILAEAKDYGSTLVLAEAVLTVRSKEDMKERDGLRDSPFYIQDLSYTKVFEHLVLVDDAHKQRALEIALRVLNDVIQTTAHDARKEREGAFDVIESYQFLDIDFFTLKLGEQRLSSRDDVHALLATVKMLAEQIVSSDSTRAQDVLNTIEQALPHCRTRWALRLFVLSLCPQACSAEMKTAWNEIFNKKNSHQVYDLTHGAEYETSLQRGFAVVLNGSEQREYIRKAIDFVEHAKDKDEKRSHQSIASDILSTLRDHLNRDERARARTLAVEINEEYQPGPAIGRSRGGFIVAQAPITPEEFGNLPIEEIVQKMKDAWRPEVLAKRNKPDEFLRPINAEGVGEILRKDIAKRLEDYVGKATLLFARGVLDEHYTCSYLRGIQEAIKTDREKAASIDWKPVLKLCVVITSDRATLNNTLRTREDVGGWLSNWNGVYSSITDVVQELLRQEHGVNVLDDERFRKHRSDILMIIGRLLQHPDPEPEDPNEKGTEPHNEAINTVRGRAFEALTLFVYRDGKKLLDDVKETYERTLKVENTIPIMFMFGHYLPTFYYRDEQWVNGLLPSIFPEGAENKDLFLAAWEGYLTESLYKELYEKLENVYKRAIALDSTKYTKRRYTKDLDEALATHLALAFVHLGLGIESSLFTELWNTPNPKRHAEFISFIGRSVITRDRPTEWIKEHPEVDIAKLKKFWDWALERNDDKEVYKAFGFWIPRDRSIPEWDLPWLAERIEKTLKKTDGDIEWEIGLTDSLKALAESSPEHTRNILELYLAVPDVTSISSRRFLQVDGDLVDVFKILHKHDQGKTRALINQLLPINSPAFWSLKDVLKD
ncbi:MAG: hypothetical protein WC654_06410, partial [Patescibacteria group bacterium]